MFINDIRNVSFILCLTMSMQSAIAIDWNWLRSSYLGKQCDTIYQRVRNIATQRPILASGGTLAGALLLWAAALKFHHMYYHNYERAKAVIDVEDIFSDIKYADVNDFNIVENSLRKEIWSDFWRVMIPLIRDKKVSVNITGGQGLSPLYMAVRGLDVQHVKELKQYGADHNQKTQIKLWDGTFDTPLKAAQRIPDNLPQWKKRKAYILDAFGNHVLLTNMELAKELKD